MISIGILINQRYIILNAVSSSRLELIECITILYVSCSIKYDTLYRIVERTQTRSVSVCCDGWYGDNCDIGKLFEYPTMHYFENPRHT